MSENEITPGTLKIGEYHPCADNAMAFIKGAILSARYFLLKEAMASAAIEGNRTAQVCLETLERIENNEVTSDRYILGLAWFLLQMNQDS